MPANKKMALRLQAKKLSHKADISAAGTGWNSMVNWIVVVAVVLPLLFSRVTMDPVLSIRYLFLSCVVLLLLVFFYALKRAPVLFRLRGLLLATFLVAICYFLWSVVCMWFSINPSESAYETSRYLLNVLFLFLVIVAVKEEPLRILKLCKAVMIAALIHSLIGILQYYKIAFMDIPGSAGNPLDPNPSLPYGLMANRNLFGSAQVLLLPFALFVLYKAERVWKYAGIISLTGVLASVILSQTRSAWLATIAMVAVALILILRFLPVQRKKWIMAILAGGGITTLVIAALLLTNRGSNFARLITYRALTLVKPSPDSFKSSDRAIEWNKSLQLIKDHAVTGVGPGNWKLAITTYGGHGTVWAAGLVLPNQPHNVYLQVASETGIPGAFLYFSLWVLIAIMGLKIISKTRSKDTRVLIIFLLSGLVAFAVDSVFSFPTERIEHCLYITITGGIILGFYANLISAEKKARINPWWLTAMVAVALFNIFLGYKKYNFEKHAILAKKYRMEGRPIDVIEEVAAGKNTWVTLDPAGEPLEMQSGAAYAELKEYDKALHEVLVAKSYHPNSARIFTTMGVIYTSLHEYDKAVQSFRHALTLAPEYDIAVKNLASVYFNMGNYGACIETIEKIKSPLTLNVANLYDEAKKRLEPNSK